MRFRASVLAVLALAGSACDRSSDPEPCLRSGESGCLIVIQRTSDAAVYVEGSISYVRVTEGSRTILDAEL
jgi:hypothetical protein